MLIIEEFYRSISTEMFKKYELIYYVKIDFNELFDLPPKITESRSREDVEIECFPSRLYQ